MIIRNYDLDIFCSVIDNYGDIGFIYRFAKEYKLARNNSRVRVFIDDLKSLSHINKSIDVNLAYQEVKGVFYIDLKISESDFLSKIDMADFIIEAFGFDIPSYYLDKIKISSSLIINLEYLSAENWVSSYHKKESLLNFDRVKKYFFMPGLNSDSGGLVLDSSMKENCYKMIKDRVYYFESLINNENFIYNDDLIIGSIFSYEKNFSNLIRDLLSEKDKRFVLIITKGKSEESFRYLLNSDENYIKKDNIELFFIDFLEQEEYDILLNICDFNFVRGEDSFARAILSGKPFLWHAYMQEDNYQLVKVKAFLDEYKKYFDSFEKFEKYSDLMISYNDRLENSFISQSNESYVDFFKYLDLYRNRSFVLSSYIKSNCSLIDNLIDFVEGL